MQRLRFFLFTLLLGVAPLAVAAPTTYSMDPSHTQVRLTWSHFGFSHPSAVVGIASGTVTYDPAHPAQASVTVRMPLSTLDTHVPALDEHLKGDDFFAAAKYPVATFTSTGVKVVDKKHLEVSGKLSVHGVTHPVTLYVTINKIGTHPAWSAPAIGFDATATLKRSAFDVARYVPVVSDAIQVHITTEAIESKAYKARMSGSN
jgi:polyisoprenoid-binding protein YceI